MGTEIDLIFVRGSILTWSLSAGRKWFFSSVGIDCHGFGVCGRNWLDWCIPAGNHSVLVSESKLIYFLCVSGRNWLYFIGGDWTWPDFNAAIENGLFLVSGSELNWFLCRGTEIDMMFEWIQTSLISAEASTWTLLLCAGSKLTWFEVADRDWLVLRVKICFVLVFGR